MASTIIFLFALSGYTLAAVPVTVEDPVNVTVYFESYCPDSVKFLTKQLYPAYITSLKDHMNITLVPYGKATKNQSGEVTCHHGEHECVGNRIIACALKNTSINFMDVFKFINCTSSIIATDTKRETYPVKECAAETPLSVEAIEECANGLSGQKYLLEYGEMTDALSPPLGSVPTVVFNEKFDAKENTEAMSNFRKTLCSKMKGTKLAECTGNSAGVLQNSVLPLVAAIMVAARV